MRRPLGAIRLPQFRSAPGLSRDLAILGLATVAGLVLARPAAAQPFAETLLDPTFVDCSGTGTGAATSASTHAGGTTTGCYAIDGASEPPATENADGDLFFGTLEGANGAVANTATGGVVAITVPGIYRPESTIDVTRSMIVRGPRDQDVVIAGGCPDTASAGISVTGSDLAVVFENLTIRSFSIGLDLSACTGCTVSLVNCRVLDNTSDGIRSFVTGEDPSTVVLVDSELYGNATALALRKTAGDVRDTTILSNAVGVGFCGDEVEVDLVRADVSNNANDGVGTALSCLLSTHSVDLTVHESSIVRNGDRGIDLSHFGAASGRHDVRITESLIAENGDDGLYVTTNNGTASLISLSESEILANGADGIDTAATAAGAAVQLALFKNSILQNVSAGVRSSGATATTFPATTGNNSACINNVIGQNGAAFAGFPGGQPPCGMVSPAASAADHESTF